MHELVVATRKGLFTLRRAAPDSWRVRDVHFLGDRVSQVLIDRRDGARYAALDHGHFGVKLHRSVDSGVSWEEIAAPAYPPRPEGFVDRDDSGKEIPWNVELIWSLAAGGHDEPGALWCGTVPGGLFRSTDRGASWQLVHGLWDRPERKQWFGGGFDYPGIHSIIVDPRDSARVVVGISCGGVWQTRDRGESFGLCARGMYAEYMPPELRHQENVQDPHCVVQCAGAPDHFWVQHHNGVFRSTDNGASWQDIQVMPSAFGFPVAVHPRDPDTAWFVPALRDERRVPADGCVVVARTRDGGASFEVLCRGLPQEHAYDLVYRHALSVDQSGDVLAVGSTTGNLWVSEDQGDSWACVSHHLPPIVALELV